MELLIPNWPAPTQIKACSSTRLGGQSSAPYSGLNLGEHVGDDWILVEKNRQRLAAYAKMPSAPVWLNQTHSTQVIELSAPSMKTQDADGAWTRQPNVVCSAMTADCLPVLLTDTEGTQVAAVHAGWRGLAGGIIENALAQFDGEVMAWLGPAIGATAFEVGQDVLDAFVAFDRAAKQAFIPREQAGKWLADMAMLATQRLNRAGVEQVYYSDLCTFNDPQRFYSYRRDGVTGRQASFIWIDSNA